MNTLADFFQRAWRLAAELPEQAERLRRPSLEGLRQTQWSDEFEGLMRNRLVMGAFRYGTFLEQKYRRHDNPASILQHCEQYQKTGNAEHLVDIANLALVEFVLPSHPYFHFDSIDDGNHHSRCISGGE